MTTLHWWCVLLCGLLAAASVHVHALARPPAFVAEQTRPEVEQLGNHHLRDFVRGAFGSGKDHALVAVLTSACENGNIEAFKKGAYWELRGLLRDPGLKRTNVGLYICYHPDQVDLCKAVFGADVNARGCEFYAVHGAAAGERQQLRLFAGEAKQAQLTAFIHNTDPTLSVEVSTRALVYVRLQARVCNCEYFLD
jgi:hypothetical protein